MRISGLVAGVRGGVLLGLCAWPAACQAKDAKTHLDVGAACVTPASSQPVFFGQCEEQELTAGAELRIDVDFGLCLSSSCDTLVRASCEVARANEPFGRSARSA
jgi:hypothetical protein